MPSDAFATYSVLTNLGLTTISTGSSSITLPSGILVYLATRRLAFRIPSNLDISDSEVFIAAKVEIGKTQTLAHQENGAWVLNEIPNYWEQLYRCGSKETITGTITKATGITSGTLDSTTCRKVGNIVTVSGRIFGMSSIIGNGDFFVIPPGFRPSQQTRVSGSITLDSTGTVVPILLAIATNGAVSVSYSQTITINQVAFVGTYAI